MVSRYYTCFNYFDPRGTAFRYGGNINQDEVLFNSVEKNDDMDGAIFSKYQAALRDAGCKTLIIAVDSYKY